VVGQYPEIFTFGAFSKKHPNIESIKQTGFEMVFFARGYKRAADAATKKADLEITTKVEGPGFEQFVVLLNTELELFDNRAWILNVLHCGHSSGHCSVGRKGKTEIKKKKFDKFHRTESKSEEC
jgi:hypothetical protein